MATIAAGHWRVAAVDYVMVPIPEELADRVLAFVSWKEAEAKAGPPAAEGLDAVDAADVMARVFARLDDPSRALLTVTAEAALEAEELTLPEAARRAGVSTREAIGILLEVNGIVVSEGGPPLAFSGRDSGASAYESPWDSHVIVVSGPIAGVLSDLARAHAAG
jgi:hypothetical protein